MRSNFWLHHMAPTISAAAALHPAQILGGDVATGRATGLTRQRRGDEAVGKQLKHGNGPFRIGVSNSFRPKPRGGLCPLKKIANL